MLDKIKHIEIDGKHYITRELAVGEVLQVGDIVSETFILSTDHHCIGETVRDATYGPFPVGYYFRRLHPKKVVEILNDKNAAIRRLKKKLENVESVFEKVKELEESNATFVSRAISLDIERSILQRWKNEALMVSSIWDKVDSYVRNHRDTTIGDTIAEKTLEFLKQRDALLTQRQNLLDVLGSQM